MGLHRVRHDSSDLAAAAIKYFQIKVCTLFFFRHNGILHISQTTVKCHDWGNQKTQSPGYEVIRF